tara:strand:+ start:378 stop:653 length:276 start_codon:yes stop_codon:yes gene_type:complete
MNDEQTKAFIKWSESILEALQATNKQLDMLTNKVYEYQKFNIAMGTSVLKLFTDLAESSDLFSEGELKAIADMQRSINEQNERPSNGKANS